MQHKISVINRCVNCKQAVCSPRVYCGKRREHVDDIVHCPDFEQEPLEYKLYRRM